MGERIAAIVASPDRSAADRSNDVRPKPAETLAFIGAREGMVALDVSAKLNAAVFQALKPGGIYVIADHSGRPGTGISESKTPHRIEAKAGSCATRTTRATARRPIRGRSSDK